MFWNWLIVDSGWTWLGRKRKYLSYNWLVSIIRFHDKKKQLRNMIPVTLFSRKKVFENVCSLFHFQHPWISREFCLLSFYPLSSHPCSLSSHSPTKSRQICEEKNQPSCMKSWKKKCFRILFLLSKALKYGNERKEE